MQINIYAISKWTFPFWIQSVNICIVISLKQSGLTRKSDSKQRNTERWPWYIPAGRIIHSIDAENDFRPLHRTEFGFKKNIWTNIYLNITIFDSVISPIELIHYSHKQIKTWRWNITMNNDVVGVEIRYSINLTEGKQT